MQHPAHALAIVNDLFDEDLDPDLFLADWEAEFGATVTTLWDEPGADAPAATSPPIRPC